MTQMERSTVPETATLTIGDQKVELPIVVGTENERGIDISQLRAKTGYITLDPGFGNTGACQSAITYIDGEAGILRYRGIPIEQLAEQSSFIEAAGLTWHLQSMGSGPTMLLLHGTGASSHSYRHLAPLLAPDYRVIVPDLPGHGFTSAAPDPSLPGMAAATAALVKHLDIAPAMVVGHSAGAAIAARMLLDSDWQPDLLVGLGSALQPFPGAAAAFFPVMARLLFANPLVPELFAAGARFGGGMEGFLQRSTGSRIDPEGVKLYTRLFQNAGHVGGALRMMAHWDLAPLIRDLPSLSTPMLLLHGKEDSAVPPNVATGVADRVAGTTVEMFPGLGHLLHEEAPDAIADRIREASIMAMARREKA